MTRRVLTLLFGALIVCGLVAQEPGDKDKAAEPPRLKKKKRDGVVPPPEAKKDDEKPKVEEKLAEPEKDKEPVKGGKGKEPPVKGGKGKEPPAKDEPIVPEDGDRGDPDEDDKDIIERVGKNMRAVEDKLANKELGEPTEQQQRDILKDIDALIRRSEQGGGGGGGGGGEDDKDMDKGEKGEKGEGQPMGGMGGEKQGGKSRAQQRKEGREQAKQGGRQRREIKSKGKSGGTKMAGGKEPRPEPGMGKGQQKPGEGGNEPGAGKGGPQNDKMNPIDLAKEVWGHLPESLRAEMNAYSNPQPFMPRYDDLIKKYYKAIAEKGRKKGD